MSCEKDKIAEDIIDLLQDMRYYTHDWDWKCGERWDYEIKRVKGVFREWERGYLERIAVALEGILAAMRERSEAGDGVPEHPCYEDIDPVVSCDEIIEADCTHKQKGGSWETCSSGKQSYYHKRGR